MYCKVSLHSLSLTIRSRNRKKGILLIYKRKFILANGRSPSVICRIDFRYLFQIKTDQTNFFKDAFSKKFVCINLGNAGDFLYYADELIAYQPKTMQEETDKKNILSLLEKFPADILSRENTTVHMTSSAFIVNETKDKVLFVFHKIYQSWSWPGGHSDGETDLLATALREAKEETGLQNILPLQQSMFSLDLLPVAAHIKKGKFVSSHLHIAPAYLLTADEQAPLQICAEENSGVQWLPLRELEKYCSEVHMLPVYDKIRGHLL